MQLNISFYSKIFESQTSKLQHILQTCEIWTKKADKMWYNGRQQPIIL